MQDAQSPSWSGAPSRTRSTPGIARDTKDFDIFVHPRDVDGRSRSCGGAGAAPSCVTRTGWRRRGWATRSSTSSSTRATGSCRWTTTGSRMRPRATCWACGVKLQPIEEMIWSKAFVMERERSDAADVAHLILRCSGRHRLGPAGGALRPELARAAGAPGALRLRVPLRAHARARAPRPRRCGARLRAS